MTSNQPLEPRIVDLDTIAEALKTALTAQPGLIRLEPTVRSVLKRIKLASVNAVHHNLRPDSPDPTASARDGLILSLTDGVLNVHIDIAADIVHPALNLAETLQHIAAETIQSSGLTVGRIDVTILSIEANPDESTITPEPPRPAATRNQPD